MSLKIPAHDRGRVYLFALPEGPASDVASLLGVKMLDLAHVDVLQLEELTGVGLRGYLTEGMGVPAAEIGPEANRTSGTVAVLRSAAFGARDATLTLAPGVRHLATYGEARPVMPDTSLRSESSEGTISGKPGPSQGAIMGRVAMIALAVLLVLAAVMVWIA